MKIELEKLFLIILLISLISLTLLLVTPLSDNYIQYLAAKYILKDPSILWRNNLTGFPYMFYGTPIFLYPPLIHFSYAFLFMLGLAPNVLDILSIIVVCYFLYRIEKRAIPFMFLSFIFIRVAVQGGTDIFLLSLIMPSIYFYDKKPEIGAILAGLSSLVKSTGLLFLGVYVISVLIFKRKEIFNKNFYKNKYFLAIIISILVMSPWYLRNFILNNGDFIGTFVGTKLNNILKVESWLNSTTVQLSQPERNWFDTTGFYSFPIDILFYVGLLFTIFNLTRTRKFEKEHIFIFTFVAIYAIVQAIQFNYLMTIRYYLPIFPLLSIQIAGGIPEKYLKFAYVGCLVFLLFFILNLPKYAFNQMDNTIGPVCTKIKDNIDSEPVYVNAFHSWYVIYRCDLNATTKEDSKWTLDFEEGNLYLTNKTNLTSA